MQTSPRSPIRTITTPLMTLALVAVCHGLARHSFLTPGAAVAMACRMHSSAISQ